MVAAGLLTYGIRLSFIALMGRITVPDWFQRALRFVPAAVLSAIIVPGLFDRGGVWTSPCETRSFGLASLQSPWPGGRKTSC